MTGWYYLKEGMFDDSHVGPLSDDTFLQMAFDGKLNLKSKVIHPQKTNNQLVFLEHVPEAKQKVNEGILERRRAKEKERDDKAADKRRAKQEKQQALIVAKEQEKQRQEEAWHRQQTLLPPLPTNSPSPFSHSAPAYSQQQQPVLIHVEAQRPADRLEPTGWFTRAFGSAAGVLVALCLFFVGGPILLCAGCFTLSAIGRVAVEKKASRSKGEIQQKLATLKKDDFTSADSIANSYDNNEVRADSIYDDSWVFVTGKVDSVGRDILDHPYVVLKTKKLLGIQCLFSNDTEQRLSNLNTGDTIYVAGIGAGKTIGMVLVKDCYLMGFPP